MKNKIKKYGIWVIFALVIGGCIGFGIYFYNHYKENNLDKIVKEINTMNKRIYEQLSTEDTIELNNIYECRKYMGSQKDEYINQLNSLYTNPFDGAFEQRDDELYVCMMKSCSKMVDIKEYEIVSEENDERLVDLKTENGSASAIMKKVEKEWKFVFPVITCE